jgi:hypothetical protein
MSERIRFFGGKMKHLYIFSSTMLVAVAALCAMTLTSCETDSDDYEEPLSWQDRNSQKQSVKTAEADEYSLLSQLEEDTDMPDEKLKSQKDLESQRAETAAYLQRLYPRPPDPRIIETANRLAQAMYPNTLKALDKLPEYLYKQLMLGRANKNLSEYVDYLKRSGKGADDRLKKLLAERIKN